MRLTIILLLLLSACSIPAVRCDKHLEAINAPGPKIGPAAGIAVDAAARSRP
jgi:hypothetical protein